MHCTKREYSEPCILEKRSNKVFCGAGVLILEMDKTNTINDDTRVVFFFDKYRQKYSEPGGKTNRHHHYDVFETGMQELCEETSLYICIPFKKTMKKLEYFDKLHEKKRNEECYFRVFILPLQTNNIKIYSFLVKF